MKVIAIQATHRDSNDISVDFFGLTQVNDEVNDYNNGILHSSYRCQLSVQTSANMDLTTFRYSSILTEEDFNPLQEQLARYCTPSDNIKWVMLQGYENEKIWVLAFSALKYTTGPGKESSNSPRISLIFPSIITRETVMDLELKKAARHICSMISCDDFLLCPATMEPPVPSPYPHTHCSRDFCTRFFEMSLLPPTTPPGSPTYL